MEIVHLFSGGHDSTLAALSLVERYQVVHLVTFTTRGVTNVQWSRENAHRLRARFGPRFTHRVLDARPAQRRIADRFSKDYATFCGGGAPGIVCMACKLAMHVQAAALCLELGVTHVSDGAIRNQADHPEMMPEVINALRLTTPNWASAMRTRSTICPF